MSSHNAELGEAAKFIGMIKSFQNNDFPVNAGQESLLKSFVRTLDINFTIQYDSIGELPNPFAVMTSVNANSNINYINTGHDEVIQDWIDDVYLVVQDLENQINNIDTPTLLFVGIIEIILIFWRTIIDL